MATNEIDVICGQLINAVRAMMDPMTPSQVRLNAFKHCEQFKEESPADLGIQCAITLSSSSDYIIRHFGLKLLEEMIKIKWNNMTPEQKLYVKESAMTIMDKGIQDIIKEPNHIKDAIARIIVEIAKREWPQQWPSFLVELETLSSKGDSQSELVMFVMLRLVEDVAVLQTLEQNQRRKEIYQALTSDMETIFKFLLTLLERHYQAYISNPMNDVKERHSKVCQSVLATFSAFVEWVPIQHIMANDYYLVKCLCHLLSDEQLQLHAAECLLGIVSSKAGKVTDRAQLLVLFKSDMISPLFQAVEAANLKTMQGEDDQHYLFLKRMVQLLVELGGQVCGIWHEKNSSKPENFNIYLNALLAFTNHNSHTVNYFANELWAKFCRHAEISKDDVFQTFIPKWVECALKKAVKVGYPSKEDHPSCAYSRMDFETDEEFSSFFGRYRLIMAEVIRTITNQSSPTYAFQFCDRWLRSLLTNSSQPNLPITKNSQIYIELDTIQWALDAVLAKLSTQEELTPILGPGLDLLKLCLDYKTGEDPLLLSVVLSCVSSLFVVVTVTPAALNPTLSYIFKCITFSKQNNESMSEEIKLLRRHGCALLVKIATRYPQALVPVFDYLRQTIIDDLFIKQKVLFKMEFVTLVEGLVLVSNEFQNFDVQSRFIESLAKPVCDQLKALEVHFHSPEAFNAFVGLDGAKDCTEQRSEVAFCLNFLVALLRRVSVPTDLLKCRNSGFIDTSVTEVLALKSPAGGVGVHVLSTILKLTKTFIEMFKARHNPALSKIFDMLHMEKNGINGQSSVNDNDSDSGGPPVQPNPAQGKLQMFVYEQFENLFNILAQFCFNLGHQFYKQPGLSSALMASVFQGIDDIPDYRMRPIVRLFMKSLINKCPKSCFGSVLAPVLSQFCPYMLDRLTKKWEQLKLARESPTFDENNTDSQEVIDDVLGRQITREWMDIIKAILTSGGGSDLSQSTATNLTGSSESLNKGEKNSHMLNLSELGNLVLRDDSLGQCLTLTLLRALNWPDSHSSARASALLELIMPSLASSEQISGADVEQVMFAILQALHTMGQNEMNSIALNQLSIQAYEQLRPKHAIVLDVLGQVPGINIDDLKKFDARVMTLASMKSAANTDSKPDSKPYSGDRALKSMFKKLTGQFVGKDVAQRFKKEVVIKNLPTLKLLKPKYQTPSLDETEHNDIGITNLFNGNSSAPAVKNTFML